LKKSKEQVSSVDVFGVLQQDGTLKVSPIFMMFNHSKLSDNVDIFLNDTELTWKMKMDHSYQRPFINEHKDKTNYELFMPTADQCKEILEVIEKTSKRVKDELPNRHKMVFRNGSAQSETNFYLYHHNIKLVITDIDGTITKSDKTGLISTILKVDYTHEGCALNLKTLSDHGFVILYLTARSVPFAHLTKEYIYKVDQDHVRMPFGPILTTPDNTKDAIDREVIRKRPDEFKIEILNRIVSLFPSNPLAIGIGNRETDDIAYSKVGIPSDRIFRIDKSSVIHVGEKVVYKGYKEMANDIKNLLN